MDPNEKLSLRYRVQRSIRRRKPVSPFWYLGLAVLLLLACVLLKVLPKAKPAPEYEGIAGTGAFTATFTGNINCVGDGKTIDADGYAEYFKGVTGIFDKADYVSVPVNDPILDDYVETYTSTMSIKFADKYFNIELADALRDIGVTDATICNKSIFLYGSKGALETARTLEMAGINISGLDTTTTSDGAVASSYRWESGTILHVGIEASDDRTRDYSTYDIRTYSDKFNNIAHDITLLREQNPNAFIAVTVSWAERYLLKPSTYMKDLCHSIIDCGADVVIGSGIEMVLSVEQYDGHYIFYGLGNLVSYEAYTMTQRGAVLNCVFDESGNVTYEVVPLTVKNGVPVISSSSIILRTLVSDIGKDVDYTIENGRLILK
ncbi:MAG: CapA family protein [Clostridia bacterium]|nr:CapA family protein [Clostridia bacterium]